MKNRLTKLIKIIGVATMMATLIVGCGQTESVQVTEESVVEEVVEETTEETTEETEGLAEGGARIVVDHGGNEVEIPEEIERVAVLAIYPLPSVITMYLGSAEVLVGIDQVSMSAAQNGILSQLFPEILDANVDYITSDGVNIESLLALEPDLVFYTAQTVAHKELLETAGIPAVGVSATSWNYDCIETYDQWIALLEQIFPEKEGKTELVSQYSAAMYDMIQERVVDIPEEEKTRAMFLFTYDDTTMVTSGVNFFGQYWATAGGGVNVGEEMPEATSSAAIDMEQVYEWNPDIIYITNFTATQPEDLYNNAIGGDDWSTVAAVQNENVHKMPLGSYRSYTPGTDTPVTLLWMAKTMYPELFEDIDLIQEVKDYYMEIYDVELADEDAVSMYDPSRDAAFGYSN